MTDRCVYRKIKSRHSSDEALQTTAFTTIIVVSNFRYTQNSTGNGTPMAHSDRPPFAAVEYRAPARARTLRFLPHRELPGRTGQANGTRCFAPSLAADRRSGTQSSGPRHGPGLRGTAATIGGTRRRGMSHACGKSLGDQRHQFGTAGLALVRRRRQGDRPRAR